VMGNGSDLLFDDAGFRGIVLKMTGLRQVRAERDTLVAEAGISLAALAAEALRHHLMGLEFASGIPGSLGGAVYMNAGAYGGEMVQVVESITALLPDGRAERLPAAELDFSYRHSAVEERDLIVLEASLRLTPGDPASIRALMDDLNARRRDKQPLEYPSAGSAFKRPSKGYAAQLIAECGLAGYAIGGAQVSEKHCGFVINRGGATAEDVRRLLAHIQSEVSHRFGVQLVPEIKMPAGK